MLSALTRRPTARLAPVDVPQPGRQGIRRRLAGLGQRGALSSRLVPFYALADRVLPSERPDLPGAVTDLWIGGQFRSGEVIWHTDGGSWRDIVTDKPFSKI
jgi:hypothetical protein